MRIGVIGYGGRISGMINNFRALAPDLRVVGVVDPDREGPARGSPKAIAKR